MIISVVNRSHVLSDADVLPVIRAINRQLREDFEPFWKFGGELRLDGAEDRVGTRESRIKLPRLPGRRGDAVIYLQDRASLGGAEGYHAANDGDIPFGFVFLDVCKAQGDPWSLGLSHEAIELVADPMNNLLVQGPHPFDRHHMVFHMFELCDAVQNEWYELDGVKVSNFVLPGYYVRPAVPGARNDFLGRPKPGDVLQPFGIAPGGYLCFYDPAAEGDKWPAVMLPDDAVAARRMLAKRKARLSRVERRRKAGK